MLQLIDRKTESRSDGLFHPIAKLLRPAIVSAVLSLVLFSPLEAQILTSPADTGRMAWGHKDFSRYDRPGMCDRAVMLTLGYETRKYDPDTVLQIHEDIDTSLPDKVIEVARNCLSAIDTDSISPRQTWSLVRVMLALDEAESSKSAIDKLLARGKIRADTLYVLGKAIDVYLKAIPARLDMAFHYTVQLDSLSGPGVQPLRFNARNNIANHWMRKYVPDSVRKYASQAIEIYRFMEPMEQDMVPINSLLTHLINIANERGDVATQEAILDTARELMSEWRQDNGSTWIDMMARSIEVRNSMYGRKTQPLDGSFWLNHQGSPRPIAGKMSLVVMANHNCGRNPRCISQFGALKRLQTMYGDRLDLTIISVTQGFAPGSGVLTPTEEAEAIAKYFTEYHKLSAAILVDEAPVHTIEDGRVIRDMAPIIYTFNDLGNANALLTDEQGRIRWLGHFSSDDDRKPLVTTINRLLAED